MRSGGIFFVCIGLGVAIGGMSRRFRMPSLILGFAVAALPQILFGRRLFAGLPRPSPLHFAALGIGLAVEILLVNLVAIGIPDRASRRFWLWILWAVGAHFVIFGFSHGPLAAMLGLLCIANASAGLRMTRRDERWFWLIDGLLKIGFGAWMLWLSFL